MRFISAAKLNICRIKWHFFGKKLNTGMRDKIGIDLKGAFTHT